MATVVDLTGPVLLQSATAFTTGLLLSRRFRPFYAALTGWLLSLLLMTALSRASFGFWAYWQDFILDPVQKGFTGRRLGGEDAAGVIVAYTLPFILALGGAHAMRKPRAPRASA